MKFLVMFLILSWAAVEAESSRHHKKAPIPPAPAPAVDCSTVVYDMMDCLSYLSEGSNVTKVDKACCKGFESVVSYDPSCLCYGLRGAASIGIYLNFTKAFALPKACGYSVPPEVTNCPLPPAPSPSEGDGEASPPPSLLPPTVTPPSSPLPAPPPASFPPPPASSSPPPELSSPPPESSSPPPESSTSPVPPVLPTPETPAPSKPKPKDVPAAAPALAPSKDGASSISMSIFVLFTMIFASFSFV